MRIISFLILLLYILPLCGEEALFELKEKVEAHPKSGEAHYDLGMYYLNNQEYQEAKQEFLLSLRYRPENNLKAKEALSKAYFESQDFERLDLLYQEIQEEDPGNALVSENGTYVHIEALLMKAKRLESIKEYSDELKVWEELIALKPYDPHFLLQTGKLYFQLKMYSSAVEMARRVLKEEPFSTEGELLLAHAYLMEGKFHKAHALFQHVLNREPNHAEALEGLKRSEMETKIAAEELSGFFAHRQQLAYEEEARELKREGEYSEAALAWQNLLKEYPKNPIYLYELGQTYQHLGELGKAEAFFHESLRLAPNNNDVKLSLAFLYLGTERAALAKELFMEILDDDNAYAEAAEGLKRADAALHEQKKREEAARKKKIEAQQIEIAHKLEEKGEYALANESWEALSQEYPGNATYLWHLAKNALTLDELELAQVYLEKALAIDPDYVDALVMLGYLYYRAQEDERAWNTFTQALAIDEGNTDAQKGVALLEKKKQRIEVAKKLQKVLFLEKEGSYHEAYELIQELVQDDLGNSEYLYYQGRLEARLGYDQKAEKSYLQALAISPHNVDVQVGLIYLYLQLNRREEARVLIDEIEESDPGNMEAEAALAILQEKEAKDQLVATINYAKDLEEEGHYESALIVFEDLYAEDPTRADFSYHIGWNYARLKRYDLAKAWTLESLHIDPDLIDAKVLLGYIYYWTRRDKEALILFNEVLQESPNYEDAAVGRELVLDRGRKKELSPETDEFFALETLEENQAYQEAISEWKTLLQKDPDNPYYLYRLGRLYSLMGENGEAQQLFMESLALDEGNIDTELALAYIYLRTDRLEEAKELFASVLEASPTYTDAIEGMHLVEKRILGELAPSPEDNFLSEQKRIIKHAEAFEKERLYDQSAYFWAMLYCDDPSDATFAFRLGSVLRFSRRYEDAIVYLEKAIQLDPQLDYARYQLALAFMGRKWYASADNVLCYLVNKDPDNSDFIEALARLRFLQKEFTASKDLYLKRFAMEAKPYHGLMNQFHSNYKWTNRWDSNGIVWGQERETDILTKLVSAQRNTFSSDFTLYQPICDGFRLFGAFNVGTERERNLINNTENLFVSFQRYGAGVDWSINRKLFLGLRADVKDAHNIGTTNFPLGKVTRFEPLVTTFYTGVYNTFQLSAVRDTLIIKLFTSTIPRADYIRRDTYLLYDEVLLIHDWVKFGFEGYLRFWHGSFLNRQADARIWTEFGLPRYLQMFYIRYTGRVGGFQSNLTDYPSYKRQWEHYARFSFAKSIPMNIDLFFAYERSWQWSRDLNQPVNTLVFVRRLFRGVDRCFFEVQQVYRPKIWASFRCDTYWDSTDYTAWTVKGKLNIIF